MVRSCLSGGHTVRLGLWSPFGAAKALWGKVQPPLTPNQLIDFVFWAVIGVIIGGRLGYVLFYDILLSVGLNAQSGFGSIYANSYYLQNPIDIPQIWQGGMSFHGGLFGLVIAMWFYARHIKSNFLSAIDLLALTTPFGLLFGRIANFINGELYGRVTEMRGALFFQPAVQNHVTPASSMKAC